MFDEDNYLFVLKDRVVDLTVDETRILKLLIENKKGITLIDDICMILYQNIDKGLLAGTRLKISRLRKKIKSEYKIVSRYNIGYTILTLKNNNVII